MKNLYSYICESIGGSYSIGLGFSVKDCIDYIFHKNQKISKATSNIDEKSFECFLKYLYSIWVQSFKNDEAYIPLRFSNSNATIKLHRDYKLYMEDIENCCKSANLNLVKKVKAREVTGFNIGKLSFAFGNGSLLTNRSAKGLGYEEVLKQNIIEFIKLIAGDHLDGSIKDQNKLIEISGDNVNRFANLFPIYLKGDFDDLLDGYIKAKHNFNFDQCIDLSGKKSTSRNKNGEIIDINNIEINDKVDVASVLKNSGNIIADVTILNKLYISAKLEDAQLSGINIEKVLNNEAIIDYILGNSGANDDVERSRKFIQDLGVDFDDLIDNIRNNRGGDVKVYDKYDKDKLGRMFQKLVGGNYWYTNPKKSVWVDAIDAKLIFEINKITISKTGKTMRIKGKINNSVDAEFEFRTDGKMGKPYPYRLFPKVSVSDLINMMAKSSI